MKDPIAEGPASGRASAGTSTRSSNRPTRVRVRTLDEWLRGSDGNGNGSKGPQPLPMLALSEQPPPPAATTEPDAPSPGPGPGRLCEIQIVHIPFPQLVAERSFELPPRSTEFVILVEPANLEAAVEFLAGRASIPPLPLSSSSIQCSAPSSRRTGGWNVAGAVLDTPDARQRLEQILSTHGSHLRPRHEPYHLWRPDSMVEQHLLPLLIEQFKVRAAPSAQATRRLDVWDLGSGVGRDAAYVARTLRHHFDVSRTESAPGGPPPFLVTGLDQRYRPRDAAAFRSFMRRQGVDDVTECRLVDLTVPKDGSSPVVEALVKERPACIYAVRYWNRPLFEAVDRFATLGTIVAVTHFAKPAEDSPWPFPHPKV